MIDKDFLGLFCDAAEHDEHDGPAFLEYGFRRGEEDQLRKLSCEQGWTTVRYPGAPWRTEDRCPDHPAAQPETPPDVVQVRG